MELIKYLSPHGGWTCEIAKLLASWLKSLGSRARRRENRRALSSVYTASFSIIISIARGKIYCGCRQVCFRPSLRFHRFGQIVSIVYRARRSRSFRYPPRYHRENLHVTESRVGSARKSLFQQLNIIRGCRMTDDARRGGKKKRERKKRIHDSFVRGLRAARDRFFFSTPSLLSLSIALRGVFESYDSRRSSGEKEKIE